MLNMFTFKPSTYSTFAMSGSPGSEMVPFPLIYDLLPSPKVTFPPFLDSKICDMHSYKMESEFLLLWDDYLKLAEYT